MSPLMDINLRPGEDWAMIRFMRPRRVAVQAIHPDTPVRPPEAPMVFSRAEWALLVSSGLLYALGVNRAGGNRDNGWDDWDEATAFRATGVTERDHLLIVASLFAQGCNFGQYYAPYPPALASAGEAIERLCRRAAEYRQMEGVQSPIEPGPWPRVARFHGGRLWITNEDRRLPDPSYEESLPWNAVEASHVDVLIDLAKQGEETTFKELAQTLGVPAERLDDLWTGTVRRVQHHHPSTERTHQ